MARRWLLAALGTTILCLALAVSAQAADYTANDLDDSPSGDPCVAGPTGDCTLREAVDEAMGTAVDDTITMVAGTHVVDSGQIEIFDAAVNGTLTINGAGAGSTIIDADGNSRIFAVFPDAIATITGVTMEDGDDFNGGAILNGGDLTLDGVVVRASFAEQDGGGIANQVEEFTALVGFDDETPDLEVRNSTIGGSGKGDGNEAEDDGGGISNHNGVVTVDNTVVVGNVADGDGGGIDQEPAGLDLGSSDPSGTTNVVNGSRIDGNFSDDDGGGIGADGTGAINVRDSRVNDNEADSDGGGLGMDESITLNMERTLVNGNIAGDDGGGIHSENDAVANITDSTISGNTVGDNGGGLFNHEDSTMNVVRSTVANNGFPIIGFAGERRPLGVSGAGFGGGIANFVEGVLNVTNSTISGNFAQDGGGIFNGDGAFKGSAPGGVADLLHVTIANNVFADGFAGGVGNDPGFLSDPGTVTMKSVLLTNNRSDFDNSLANCGEGDEPSISEGTNLEDGDTCEFGSTPGDGDLVNTNPVIGDLADNGGETLTHALLDGSPAIHAASNDGCPSTDQRLVSRPQGPACDIGAYEVPVESAPPPQGTAAPVAGTTPAATPGRPRVRVAGVRRACVRRSFVARFRITLASGATLRSVRVTVDGRRVSTRRRSRLALRINVRRLRAGRHRLRIVVTDSAGNRRTVTRTFTKCAQRAQRRAAPRFTG